MDPCAKEATIESVLEILAENSKQLALLNQSQQYIVERLEGNNVSLTNLHTVLSGLVSEVKELRIVISEVEKDVNNLGAIVRHIRDEDLPELRKKDAALELELNGIKSSIGEVSISGLDKRLAASETIITGIKVVASGITLAIIGIAAAAIFGGP